MRKNVPSDFPSLLQAALTTLRAHSASHDLTQEAIEQAKQGLARTLSLRPTCHLTRVGGGLWMDGVPATVNPLAARNLCREMAKRRVQEVVICREVGAWELQELLNLLCERPEQLDHLGGTAKVFRGLHVPHILVIEDPAAALPGAEAAPAVHHTAPKAQGDTVATGALLEEDLGTRLYRLRILLESYLTEAFFHGLEELISALNGNDPERRAQAIITVQALASTEDWPDLPSGALPLLFSGLVWGLVCDEFGEQSPAACEAAAHVLGVMGYRGHLEGAQENLERLVREGGVRGAECRARILGSPHTVSPILQGLAREGHGFTDRRALPFFRILGTDGARILTQILGQESNRSQRNRLLELLKALVPLSLPALRECLEEGPWFLVRNALGVLAELRDEKALGAAHRCLEHGDLRVRRAAIHAVWKIGGVRVEGLLLELLQCADPETQIEVLAGLGQIRSKAAITAIGVLASNAPEALHIKALEALGAIGQPGAIPLLVEHLQRKRKFFRALPSREVRFAAARALAAIGTYQAWLAIDQAAKAEPSGPIQETLQAIANAQRFAQDLSTEPRLPQIDP